MKKITIRTPEDIVETAVDTLGYRPENSLVLLGIMDPGAGEGPGLGVLRIDYSTAVAMGFADGAAGDVLDLVRGLGDVKTVLPAVFCSDLHDILGFAGPIEAQSWKVHRDGIYAVCDQLADSGFDVGRPVWAAADLCGDFASPRNVHRCRREKTRPAGLAEAAALPTPDSEIVRAKELLGTPAAAFAALADSLAQAEHLHMGGASPNVCAGALSPQALNAADAMLANPRRRDLLMLLMAFQNPGLQPAELPEECDEHTERMLLEEFVRPEYMNECVGYSEALPDMSRLELGCELMKTIAAYAASGALPDALAVLAWLEWVRGRLSFSDYYASAALHLDPEHSLARLQAAAAEQAVLPGWLR
ncbi:MULTISPECIES: DUF4192 family protein [unclassified Brevibacterium]|uniref:DUF4192 family protein n=1 Tax=unclassified Brevibacterium TaxID=2614124 RepID=UPI0008A13FBC|nr:MULTISPECIES: DUF4192 family protein [unclassified Brevibacterium]OFL64420.1 hypothetical protein HMPREF2757_00405 [Brevibacterium sp. HMSC063G07]